MPYLKQHYETLEQALVAVADARDFQTKTWPSTKLENGGERTFEGQLLLVEEYTLRLRKVWNETQSYVDDGDFPNAEGRARIKKYAAIVANLALWAVQAATGETVEQDPETNAALKAHWGITGSEEPAAMKPTLDQLIEATRNYVIRIRQKQAEESVIKAKQTLLDSAV